MKTKPTKARTISDLAQMAHDLEHIMSSLPYACFGGFTNGKEARAILKRAEAKIDLIRTSIPIVNRNRRLSVRREQKAELEYLAKELGVRLPRRRA